MILVLLGGGCLRDLDHPHPEPVQVVVDALQKLQHLRPLFLPMLVCTSFLLANISRWISFRIFCRHYFSVRYYLSMIYLLAFVCTRILSEISVNRCCTLAQTSIPTHNSRLCIYSKIKWKKCLSCPTVPSLKACTCAWWLSLPERNTKVQLICLFHEKFIFRIDMKHFLKCLQTLFMKICLQTPN